MAKGKKTGGRTAGTPNKLNADLKEMILEALDRNGGVEYLAHQAQENPKAFITLLGRVLPMQVNASGDVGITLKVVSYGNTDTK